MLVMCGVLLPYCRLQQRGYVSILVQRQAIHWYTDWYTDLLDRYWLRVVSNWGLLQNYGTLRNLRKMLIGNICTFDPHYPRAKD